MSGGAGGPRETGWPALAEPIAAAAPWRTAEPAQPDPHAADWAGPRFSHPGPTENDEARQLADAEAWAGRLPPPGYGYAEWLAEGREPEHEAGRR
jgi:hypothetical protein